MSSDKHCYNWNCKLHLSSSTICGQKNCKDRDRNGPKLNEVRLTSGQYTKIMERQK